MDSWQEINLELSNIHEDEGKNDSVWYGVTKQPCN